MSVEVVVSLDADFDVDFHAEFIRRSSLRQAIRFYDAVAASYRRLADSPELGAKYGFRRPKLSDLRVWAVRGFPNHLIFYRLAGRRVEIVRLLHGARDMQAAFGERLDR